MPLMEAAKLNRIPGFIKANLVRADLTVDLITSRMGVSSSVLYRMFQPLGGVPTRVRQRNLLSMRRALAQWSDTRSIRAVARASGSHTKGSFREAFGVTPGECRQSVPVAGPGPMRGGDHGSALRALVRGGPLNPPVPGGRASWDESRHEWDG